MQHNSYNLSSGRQTRSDYKTDYLKPELDSEEYPTQPPKLEKNGRASKQAQGNIYDEDEATLPLFASRCIGRGPSTQSEVQQNAKNSASAADIWTNDS